jgi:predicted TIM-barrel fold metal-dependent hydrolase
MPKTHVINQQHVPLRAAFPAVDAHNHLWGNWDAARLVEIMDAVGVVSYCDLTANIRIAWTGGGYTIEPQDIAKFFRDCAGRFPGKLYGFTSATFSVPTTQPLFARVEEFAARTVEMLQEHVALGARGLKVLKELGLHYRDASGNLIPADHPGFAPIWEEAGRLGVPVLIHQADPVGFFDPATPENEHYQSLQKYPTWSFADPKFPRHADLLRRRDNLVRSYPGTTFILPHVANYPENLAYVSQLLDENPNVFIDFSARIDELGRQPYSSRAFFIKYQDRILFGTDMPASVEIYRSYFRFLETFDEGFYPPDYDGTFDRARWPICGIGLPSDVLAKIYFRNALRLIPGLRNDLAGIVPE